MQGARQCLAEAPTLLAGKPCWENVKYVCAAESQRVSCLLGFGDVGGAGGEDLGLVWAVPGETFSSEGKWPKPGSTVFFAKKAPL